MELKIMEAIVLICVYIFAEWMIKRTVMIYGHNMDGKCILIGMTFIRIREDCFEINIRENVTRRNYTDVYDILIGDFVLGREDESVVVIRAGGRKSAVGAYVLEEVITINI